MNLRELSEKYLGKTLENPNAAGTPYTLFDTTGTAYPVTGTVGDIATIVDPVTGESIITRSIETTCRMLRLPVRPERGWTADLPGLNGNVQRLYVQEVRPDQTIGLYYFTMSLNLEEDVA